MKEAQLRELAERIMRPGTVKATVLTESTLRNLVLDVQELSCKEEFEEWWHAHPLPDPEEVEIGQKTVAWAAWKAAKGVGK